MEDKLTIGSWVEVSALAYREYIFKEGQRTRVEWQSRAIKPKLAIITGLARRFNGVQQTGCGGEEPEPSYLEITGSVKLWRVRFGLINNEHFSFEADLQEYLVGCFRLPYRDMPEWIAEEQVSGSQTNHG